MMGRRTSGLRRRHALPDVEPPALTVCLAGGGTSGHINPALAVAAKLRERLPALRLIYTGTANGLESELVPRAGLDFRVVEAKPFKHDAAGFVRALNGLRHGRAQCLELLRKERPFAVFATGGYASAPLLAAAAHLGIPRILHEQNAIPGRNNRLMARGAETVCVSFDGTERYFPHTKRVVLSGNPIAAVYFQQKREEARERLGLAADEPFVLVSGGSLGARRLNETVIAYAAACWKAGGESFEQMPKILLGCGKRLEEEARAMALAAGTADCPKLKIAGYLFDMVNYMTAADFVVGRAGAGFCAELAALGKAAVLVPYGYAANQHQLYNARTFVRAGGAYSCEDAAFTPDYLKDCCARILGSPERRRSMETASRSLARAAAADTIADEILRFR